MNQDSTFPHDAERSGTSCTWSPVRAGNGKLEMFFEDQASPSAHLRAVLRRREMKASACSNAAPWLLRKQCWFQQLKRSRQDRSGSADRPPFSTGRRIFHDHHQWKDRSNPPMISMLAFEHDCKFIIIRGAEAADSCHRDMERIS